MNPVATHCPECRRSLNLIHRLRKSNFCSPEHRDAWLMKLDAAILDRLGSRPTPRRASQITWTEREPTRILALTPYGQQA